MGLISEAANLKRVFNQVCPETSMFIPIGKRDGRMAWGHVGRAELGGRFRALERMVRKYEPGALGEMDGPTVGRVCSLEAGPDGLFVAVEVEDAGALRKVSERVLSGISIVWEGDQIVGIKLVDRDDRDAQFGAWMEKRYLKREASVFSTLPTPPSGATELLAKAAGLGGNLDMAVRLHPDLVARVKSEPLPQDMLPTDRLKLLSLRSGIAQNEILKADAELLREYDAELRGVHPIQREHAARYHESSRQSELLRKSVTAAGPIAIGDVTVTVDGEVVEDAITKSAWISLARTGHNRARGVVIQAHGAIVKATDVQVQGGAK